MATNVIMLRYYAIFGLLSVVVTIRVLVAQRLAVTVWPEENVGAILGLDRRRLHPLRKRQLRRLAKVQKKPKSDTLLSDSLPGKPYIILHYGPAKTGTSTFQNEMSVWKDRVYQLDNVLYGGAYYVPGKFMGRLELQGQFLDIKLQCSKEMARVRKKWEASNNGTLKESLREVPCFSQIMETLEEYHANGTSLIFSNELKSTFTAWANLPGYNHVVSQDWISIAAALGDEWNFLLVLGHRPYLDWIPSAKTQVDKFKPSKPRLANWPEAGGGKLKTLFPGDTLVSPGETMWNITGSDLARKPSLPRVETQKGKVWRNHWNQNVKPFMHSTKIHKLTARYIPIQFLHLYDSTPIRTNFLCNILSITPRSCQASIEADKNGESKLAHMNSGKENVDRIWYDQLAVKAVEEKLVSSTAISRERLTEECVHFHENVLNRTILDFPHRCPHPTALRAMWDLSWSKEKEMLGGGANRTLHVDIFRRNLASGKYCNIDAKKAMEKEEWMSFFSNLSNTKKGRSKQKNVRDLSSMRP